MIGDIVKVTVDRPLGSYHPKHRDMFYSVNYGYIEGIIAPDGEEQDAYVLGVDEPVKEFVGKIIAIIHRHDDVEEKWVVAPEGKNFTVEQIKEKVAFTEKYFKFDVIT
ncbi:MAG: inorganic pyrophosphatase [Lachnospiraceae bacterium]|nr:inorganic pyrophosphatase [Lachnospiraceae bacterium]